MTGTTPKKTTPTHVSKKEFEELFRAVCNWGRWGNDDERGTLNYIQPEHIRRGAGLVRSGRSVSMAVPINQVAGPDNPRPATHYMVQGFDIHSDRGEPQFSADYFASEFHGDCHTHLDALCHIFWRGKMYNGFDADQVTSHGANRCAIDLLRGGIVGRGVLLDIPKLRGVRWLEDDDGILPSDLDAAEKEHGVRVEEGDILLVRNGRALKRRVKGPWNVREGCAGLEASCLGWLYERRVAALGGDGHNDLAPSPYKLSMAPIHLGAIAMIGIHLIDNADLEELAETCKRAGRYHFMFTMAPLVLQRGTASPVNPLAIF